jgi:hypothetical protein
VLATVTVPELPFICDPAIIIAEEFTGSVLFDLAFLALNLLIAECTPL